MSNPLRFLKMLPATPCHPYHNQFIRLLALETDRSIAHTERSAVDALIRVTPEDLLAKILLQMPPEDKLQLEAVLNK